MAARKFMNITSGHWEWGVIDNDDLPTVIPLASDSNPKREGVVDPGVQSGYSREDHVHPAVVATDPGDIADPTIATAEDVALKLNTLMANLRTAGLIA